MDRYIRTLKCPVSMGRGKGYCKRVEEGVEEGVALVALVAREEMGVVAWDGWGSGRCMGLDIRKGISSGDSCSYS